MLPAEAGRPPILQACLNGRRATGVPVTPDALAAAAAACAAVGATEVHVHPRGATGRESLAADDVAAAVTAVRAACPGMRIGVSTAAWIDPDPVAAVRAWAALPADGRPDHASVNVHEEQWERVAEALLDTGIGVEAGVWYAADVPRLANSTVAGRCLRVLVEAQSEDPATAINEAADLVAALPAGPPLLVHGQEGAAWAVLEWALDRGYDTRIGLEDTLVMPDGLPAPDSASEVAAAVTFLSEQH